MPSRQAIFAQRQRKLNLVAGHCAQCGAPRAAGCYRCARCNEARRLLNKLAKRASRARRAADG